MGQNEQEMRHDTPETGQPPAFRRPHGTRLVIATRRGSHVEIPCPRCRRRTPERFWHAHVEKGVCDRCWTQLEQHRLPAVLTEETP